MADYTVNIGGNTTLMIRDTGGWVEFWVKTGPQTYNYQQPWGYHANGSNSGTLYYRMLRGGDWQKFGQVYVSYDQDVRFTIVNSGLGFPSYDFWQHITRSTVPGPPNLYDVTPISATHIHVEFAAGHDGGSPVVEWQIGYGADGNYPQYFWGSDGVSDVGPFSSGERVYFWARGRNSLGWGAWSNRGEARTWRVPVAPHPITFSQVTQTSLRTHFQDKSDGGTGIVERQVGYGLNASAPTNFAGDFLGVNDIANLVAGRTYYFWGRSRNSVGWSAWSERSQVNLIAGARIFIGNEWKRAVPYIKVAGVWKVARPWVRNAGTWKETSL